MLYTALLALLAAWVVFHVFVRRSLSDPLPKERALQLDGIGVASIMGLRPHQEDTFSHRLAPLKLFSVFDGHGGDRASRAAESELQDTITRKLAVLPALSKQSQSIPFTSLLRADGDLQAHGNSLTPSSPSITPIRQTMAVIARGLRDSFLQFDLTFCERASKFDWDDGTTAVLALVSRGVLFVANVGDSRAVLVNHGAEPSNSVPQLLEQQLVTEGSDLTNTPITIVMSSHDSDSEPRFIKKSFQSNPQPMIPQVLPRVPLRGALPVNSLPQASGIDMSHDHKVLCP